MIGLKKTELEYPSGPFSIGVGCIVTQKDKVLLVKITYGHQGWMLPGGYVRATETIGEAAKREMLEETGLIIEPVELVSVRSRVKGGKSDLYATFIARVIGGELKTDGREVREARYFTLVEMQERTDVPRLNPTIVSQIAKNRTGFRLSNYTPDPQEKYELWI